MKYFKDNMTKKNIESKSNNYIQDDNLNERKNEIEFFNDLFDEIDENIKKNKKISLSD
jgi:hypothetical protein